MQFKTIILKAKPTMFVYYQLFFILVLTASNVLNAQKNEKVDVAIDTTAIRIGEQIQYTITVETDSLDVVHFPEDQTFSPLEMVEALKIDTLKKGEKLRLQRKYALTQFDSGVYVIPPQRIAINEMPVMTDSFQIKVGNVPVDTTKQKLYGIKTAVKVKNRYTQLWKWVIGSLIFGLLLIGGLLLWFFLKKNKSLSKEEQIALLPPYDRALLQLKELENSRYLIQDEYKKYYTQLTDIIRSYLEEEVNVSALESTSDQLIAHLELLRDSGNLNLDTGTIAQFKKVFRTADLVKFAKSKPLISAAEEDRKAVQTIVVKTKEALPSVVEEDQLSEEQLQQVMKLRRKKRLINTFGSVLTFVLFFVAAFLTFKSVGNVKESVLLSSSKALLEGEWVKSAYGYPPITLSTPNVLRRVTLPEPNPLDSIQDRQVFAMVDKTGLFSVSVKAETFSNERPLDFEQSVEQLLVQMEGEGAKNLITKNEEAFTKDGIQGVKVFGSYKKEVSNTNEDLKVKYAALFFGGTGFQQQLTLIWPDSDTYAEEIVQRVIGSLEVKTPE
ncbi:MAG: hypothetical protein AAGF77_02260 [Bacteroidota bacterium]